MRVLPCNICLMNGGETLYKPFIFQNPPPTASSLHLFLNLPNRSEMSLRILQSASRQRRSSLPLALVLRSFSTSRISTQAKDTRAVSELYIEACERTAQLEKRWLARRKASPEARLDQHSGPFTWPSESHLGPFDTNVWPEAQREVERHSKYAWVSADDCFDVKNKTLTRLKRFMYRQVACNYGSKICLQAGPLYFSLDETKSESGIYLVSVAWRSSRKFLEKKADTDRFQDNVEEATFPYGPRRVLFRGETLREAIRLADAMLEKNLKSAHLLGA